MDPSLYYVPPRTLLSDPYYAPGYGFCCSHNLFINPSNAIVSECSINTNTLQPAACQPECHHFNKWMDEREKQRYQLPIDECPVKYVLDQLL